MSAAVFVVSYPFSTLTSSNGYQYRTVTRPDGVVLWLRRKPADGDRWSVVGVQEQAS